MESNHVRAESKVVRATVFLYGAEVTRSGTADLLEGDNVVEFEGIPESADPGSLSASSDAGAVTGASMELGALAPARRGTASEAIDEIDAEIAEKSDRVRVLDAEARLLEKGARGARGEPYPESVARYSEFYVGRLTEILAARRNLSRELKALKERKSAMEAEAGDFSEGFRRERRILVSVRADRACRAEVSAAYFTREASWSPSYDIRARDGEKEISIALKGEAMQSTGEDWEGIGLTLSTGRPEDGGRLPSLDVWRIDSFKPRGPPAPMARAVSLAMEDPMEKPEITAASPSSRAERGARTDYALSGSFSVPSGPRGATAAVWERKIAADIRLRCVPKLAPGAFLAASAKGWESLGLIDGPARVFQDGSLSGTASIEVGSFGDAMEVPLGRRASIASSRERGRDMRGDRMFGKSAEAAREWIITVRNTGSSAAEVEIMDQIPVSVSKSVSVEAAELSGGRLDEATGIVTWLEEIPAGGSARKVLRYAVSHPRDEAVRLE
ncbi:MAG: mucoidy inhibitor MuiA family protein [Candidatus Methanoplasma sp.]|jgi:uncharacterized protein (TIGR02231 family)|nr:mucoidy inhibitor MuiA family protein [Candidatus Methanoplasma sp.]